MLDVPGFARSSLGIVQANPVEMRLAFESLDPGPSHERNPRAVGSKLKCPVFVASEMSGLG
jgi:hypothetical protein